MIGTPAIVIVNRVARGGVLFKDPLAVTGERFVYINAKTGRAKTHRGAMDVEYRYPIS